MKKNLVIILVVVLIIGVIIAGILMLNKNNYKVSILEKYNLTENKYNSLKKLVNKANEEIKRQNIEDVDLYYAKESNFLVVRGSEKSNISNTKVTPQSIINGMNYIYLEITEKKTTVYNSNDKISAGFSAEEYYGGGFQNAKNDTSYKDFIYFSSLQDLLHETNY